MRKEKIYQIAKKCRFVLPIIAGFVLTFIILYGSSNVYAETSCSIESQGCYADHPCCAGWQCKNNKCVGQEPGEPCDSEAFCRSGLDCRLGKCCFGLDKFCSSDPENCCLSSVCSRGRCVRCVGMINADCSRDPCCRGLTCQDKKCVSSSTTPPPGSCVDLDKTCTGNPPYCCDGLACKADLKNDPSGKTKKCFYRLYSAEPFAFGSYPESFGGLSACGDQPDEFVITSSDGTNTRKCCRFEKSWLVKKTREGKDYYFCRPNDGRMEGKYLQMHLTYKFETKSIECGNIVLKTFDKTLYEFKDPVAQEGNYKATVNPDLNSYTFEFEAKRREIYPSEKCFTGDVVDYTKCNLRPTKVLDFPCYCNATSVSVFEGSNKICDKPIPKDICEKCGI